MSQEFKLRPRRKPPEYKCHWPGCEKQVEAAMWGCKKHWLTLPRHLRDEIWRNYRPGQEERMDPSHAYVNAAIAAHDWIVENYDKY